MNDFPTQLSTALVDVFPQFDLDRSLAEVRRSARPDLGDFQWNGALAGAKQKGQNPRQLAEQVKQRLGSGALWQDVSVAGPGFLNFVLSDEALSKQANRLAEDPRSGVAPAAQSLKVLVDFSGPNVAKPMHVGHLRATIIGDSLQRIGRFLGHKVTSDAHFGDWGLQIGLLIISLQDEQPDQPYFREDYDDSMWVEEPPVSMEDLDRMYPAASARMKGDEAYRDRARKATAELQKGRPGYLALHRHFWKVSKFALEREFAALDIHFDLWKGESDVNYLIDEIVSDTRARGVAVPSEGAIVIPVAREDDKKEIPPMLLVSSEGSAMYGTTDLATIVERERHLSPDLYLYVVDQRQALHFQQVYRAAEQAGYSKLSKLEHIGFGTMNGPDGKPFKTRAGDVIKLHDLIQTCTEKALEKMEAEKYAEGLSPEEKRETARLIGTGALKFADLSNYRMTDYVFDFDRFTSFVGKTGPYLQYQVVRVKSLTRKAASAGLHPGGISIASAVERNLVLLLDGFNFVVHQAWEKRAPNLIAEHLFTLSQAFSSFWNECHILTEPDQERAASWLRLSQTVGQQLEVGLGLLGIRAPERM